MDIEVSPITPHLLQQQASSRVTIEAALAAARRKWPKVHLSRRDFEAHLASLGVEGGSVTKLTSLYLCAACALGDHAAWHVLEKEYIPQVRRYIPRFAGQSDFRDEVLQSVRERLLCGRPPKIARFSGLGSFGGWLRTMTIRVAIDHWRSRNALCRWERPMDGAPAPASAHPPESPDCTPARVSDQSLERLLVNALQNLSGDDRRLMSAHYLEGRPVDRLCHTMDLDRSTVYRRLRKTELRIRHQLLSGLQHADRSWTEEELPTLLRAWEVPIDLSTLAKALAR